MKKEYNQYLEIMRKKADVDFSIAVLSWDKEVYLPKKGAALRAQQVATLEGISFEIFADKSFGKLLKTLNKNKKQLKKKQARNVELTLQDYERNQKLDKEFVMRRSQTVSKAYHAWLAAREANDYSKYQESLGELVKIKREEAEKIGYKKHPYDALMDEFEPGMTVAKVDILFKDVREKLVAFTSQLRKRKQVKNDFLSKKYPKDKQWDLGLKLLKNMGYDFDAGRQDVSPHPFTTSFGPDDVRVTTRIDERDLANMVWSCIHEGGHALYEQGLLLKEYGLPCGTFCTLGIHESQSRLWENHVGRSLEYSKAHFNKFQKAFPKPLGEISAKDFYKGVNKVAPNFIRTEADELHYHFHVMIRYEIEKALIEGTIEVKDLDKYWNKQYKNYLGVKVPDANQGILQDVHWAFGAFGYFPTYSLGSFYAAQFFAQAEKDIPNLKKQIAKGDNAALLAWLRKKIHRHGKYYSAEDLCKKVTGEALNFDYFMAYAEEKFGGIYFDFDI